LDCLDFVDSVMYEDLDLKDEEIMDLVYNDRYNEEVLNQLLGK